jgi:hypothetical protein
MARLTSYATNCRRRNRELRKRSKMADAKVKKPSGELLGGFSKAKSAPFRLCRTASGS